MIKENEKLNSDTSESEIDIVFAIKKIWKSKFILLKSIIIFFSVGLIFTLIQPNKGFEASISFLVKNGENSNSSPSFSSLASLAGVNIPVGAGNSGDIGPSLYPRLIKSTKFKQSLINTKITIPGHDSTMTYAYYYEKIVKPGKFEIYYNYILNIPSFIKNSFSNSKIKDDNFLKNETGKILELSSSVRSHYSRIEEQIEFDTKDGVMVISFNMPDPLMAAQMTQRSYELLEEEVINFKIANLNEERLFTEALYLEKKQEFIQAQESLGLFRERNQNVISPGTLNQLQRLESEYQLKFGLYNEVAKNLESIKIQIKKNTPIFSLIDPVILPETSISGFSWLYMVSGLLIGIVSGLIFIFSDSIFLFLEEKWNKLD
jgi:hypothetical protein